MTLLAWIGAFAIGLSLGLLGSGGSILTVPVLAYVVGEPEKMAIAESLAIVGAIAAISLVPYARKRLVSWSTVLLFSLPGMMGSYVGALGGKLVSGHVQITAFSVIMILAALLMLRAPMPGRDARAPTETSTSLDAPVPSRVASFFAGAIIGLQGFAIGIATGFLGVGGGFLIVPALVLLVGLPMHLAIGTSLATIALNSATGFYKHAQLLTSVHVGVHWPIVASFIACGVLGSVLGSAICHRLPQRRLRTLFAWMVLALGTYLLWRSAGLR
jgi:uncharacterized membrane protein YfcA